jgi:hypothetical protein
MQNTTATKHATDCRRVFNRLDPGCDRCVELASGAEPRKWSGTSRREQDARRIAEIRAHDCRASRCGPVCTAFDW